MLTGINMVNAMIGIFSFSLVLFLWTVIRRQNKRISELSSDLLEAEKYMNKIDEHMIISITDKRGSIEYVNSRFCEISQYDREFLIGKNHRILKSDIHPKNFYFVMWATLQSGQVWRGEICNRSKDGGLYWTDSIIIPYVDSKKNQEKYISVKIDISQRKILENILKENKERFDLYLQASESGVWDCDLAQQKIFYSNRFGDLLGYHLSELPSTFDLWGDLIHPQDRDGVIESVRQHLFGDKHLTVECRIKLRQGLYRWFSIQGQCICSETGIPKRIVGSLTDVHERILSQQMSEGVFQVLEQRLEKRADQLKKSEEMFRLLVQQVHDCALFLIDPNGLIATWNEGAEAITGWRVDEVLGRSFTCFSFGADPAGNAKEALLSQAFGGVIKWEGWSQKKDGRRFWAEIIITPIYYADAELKWFSYLMRDVTLKKKFDDNLKHALEREKELNQQKTDFISVASHEFRTPLTTILGSTQLIKNHAAQLPPEKNKAVLERIEGAIGRMSVLLNDVIAINRLESANISFDPQPVKIVDFVQKFIEEVVSGDGKEYKIHLKSAFSEETLLIDKNILRSVMGNLLSNAIKYSKTGSAIFVRLDHEQGYLRMDVEDEGVGIADDEREHIFGMFVRGKNVGSVSGTGLGLYIVRKMLMVHQGVVDFENKMTSGTIFTVKIPWQKDMADGVYIRSGNRKFF